MRLLLPLSWLYGLIIRIRNACYDRRVFRVTRIQTPVISVGNLTTGGTGKTPLAEYIVKYCLDKGKRVAIVSRGYKRTTTGTVVVSNGEHLLKRAEEAGDEPYQMANKFPAAIVIVDEHRVRGAQLAVAGYGAGLVVLDDAFQHRSIYRDLNIVTIDGKRMPGSEPMLPAGRRREQLSSLSRADLIVVSGWDKPSDPAQEIGAGSLPVVTMKLVPRQLMKLSDKKSVSLESVKGKSCIGVCGIGNPGSFKTTLQELGAELKGFLAFPDHHRYRQQDVSDVWNLVQGTGAEFILTTEKDAVRLQVPEYSDAKLQERTLVVIAEAGIAKGREVLHHKIDTVLR
jgi:tetraacyldisaccharide 4'-kinase